MRPIILLILFLAITCLKGQDRQVTIITGKSVAETIKLSASAEKLLFIYFHADWVQPCQWMKTQTFTNPGLIQFFNENALVLELNIENRIGNLEKENFNVKSLPTMMLFDASGNQLFRLDEAMESNKLLSLLKTWNVKENKRPGAGNVTDGGSNSSLGHLTRPGLIPEDKTAFRVKEKADYDIVIRQFNQYEMALHYAQQFQQRVDKKVYVLQVDLSKALKQYQIRIGTFSSQQEATAYLPQLRILGIYGEIIKL